MAKDKRYYYNREVDGGGQLPRCKIKRIYVGIGSVACSQCKHCKKYSNEKDSHNDYIICKVITKATGKE
jgi:hypothetical protein